MAIPSKIMESPFQMIILFGMFILIFLTNQTLKRAFLRNYHSIPSHQTYPPSSPLDFFVTKRHCMFVLELRDIEFIFLFFPRM